MEKYYQLRQSILNRLPETLNLSNFEYEEKHFEKTNDFVSIFSIPVVVNSVNIKTALDCGMSTSILSSVLNGEEILNKFCFAFRTFGKKTTFYFWSETEIGINPLRLPYFQSINPSVSSYGVKPIDEFPNVLAALICEEENSKKSINYYIQSITERSELFSNEKKMSVNLKNFMLEFFLSHHSEPISLKIKNNKESSSILIEKFKDEKLFKTVIYDVNNYSLGYVVKKLT